MSSSNGESNTRDEEVGALWEKTSQKGPYMTGSITLHGERLDVVVFPNKYKNDEKHPSWRIYKSRPKQEARGGGDDRAVAPSQRQAANDAPAARRAEGFARPAATDDDIPF